MHHYLLLVILLFSCNYKAKTNLQNDSINKPQISKSISKIQGNIRSGIQDKAGNLWFGTTGHGLYRYNPATDSLTHFTGKDGLSHTTISCLLEDKGGTIWVGTESGVCRYAPGAAAFTALSLPVSSAKNTNPFPEKTISPTQNEVRSILQDRNGKLWFGTGKDGVYCYDGKLVTHFLHGDRVKNEGKLRLEAVNSIVQDHSGNIWFATWFEGLCRYDGTSLTSFKPNNEVWYQTLLVDKAGALWISRRTKGACRYDGKTFTNVLQHGELDSCYAGPLLEDKHGNIWFTATAADMTRREKMGGLWRYNPSAAKKPDSDPFTNFNAKHGLDSYTILCAVEDRTGDIWVSARDKGLYRYNGKTFTRLSE